MSEDLVKNFHKKAEDVERELEAKRQRRLEAIRQLQLEEEEAERKAAEELQRLNLARRPRVGEVVEQANGHRFPDAVLAGLMVLAGEDTALYQKALEVGEARFPDLRAKGKPGRKKGSSSDAVAQPDEGKSRPAPARDKKVGAPVADPVTPVVSPAAAAE